MLQYYKALRIYPNETTATYWRLESVTNILPVYDFIIPLGTKKPTNIPKGEIRE